jgi:F420-non-reducing hydrogenase iron-sulfur subunit
MQYPTNIRVIRVMCSATVSPHHILRAFQEGVDGVFVGGCRLGDCHYLYGNYSCKKRTEVLRKLLGFTGIAEERLRTKWISSAEAPEFISEMKEFVETVKALGRSPLREV